MIKDDTGAPIACDNGFGGVGGRGGILTSSSSESVGKRGGREGSCGRSRRLNVVGSTNFCGWGCAMGSGGGTGAGAGAGDRLLCLMRTTSNGWTARRAIISQSYRQALLPQAYHCQHGSSNRCRDFHLGRRSNTRCRPGQLPWRCARTT